MGEEDPEPLAKDRNQENKVFASVGKVCESLLSTLDGAAGYSDE